MELCIPFQNWEECVYLESIWDKYPQHFLPRLRSDADIGGEPDEIKDVSKEISTESQKIKCLQTIYFCFKKFQGGLGLQTIYKHVEEL